MVRPHADCGVFGGEGVGSCLPSVLVAAGVACAVWVGVGVGIWLHRRRRARDRVAPIKTADDDRSSQQQTNNSQAQRSSSGAVDAVDGGGRQRSRSRSSASSFGLSPLIRDGIAEITIKGVFRHPPDDVHGDLEHSRASSDPFAGLDLAALPASVPMNDRHTRRRSSIVSPSSRRASQQLITINSATQVINVDNDGGGVGNPNLGEHPDLLEEDLMVLDADDGGMPECFERDGLKAARNSLAAPHKPSWETRGVDPRGEDAIA